MSWSIDIAHSAVEFSVRHMMISTVRGRFEEFEGTVEFDERNPENTTVDVTVQTGSINTREEKRDGHLMSEDFFDVEKYPVMTFKSTNVEKIDDSHAKMTGDLTIKDVTKPITLDVEYAGQAKSPWGTMSAGFTANGKINRKDWGLGWNQALETGGVLVGEEVKIHIEVELVKQEEAEAAATA